MNDRKVTFRQDILKMKVKVFTFIFTLFISFPLLISAQDDTYPTEERLFYIARSKNNNLVCYDVNLQDGKLNTKHPLNVYWLNREKNPGKTNGLSVIEDKFAYGYKLISEGDDTCEITLNAYPKRPLTISKKGGKYVCLMEIDKHIATLNSLYVKAKPNNSISVEYVELQGNALDTQQSVSERVKK